MGSFLPNKDLWNDTCTLQRLVRSVNSDMQEIEKAVTLLTDEPCCFYQKTARVVTVDGVVYQTLPRVTVAPGNFHQRPAIDDVFVIADEKYQTKAVTNYTDYDGKYLGTTVDLAFVGIVDANE